MTVEMSAVREGTRWDFRGQVVVVDEVTPRSVIHCDLHGNAIEVTPIETFIKVAGDPEAARHTSLVKRVERCILENGERKDLGFEVMAYLLERVGPPLPIAALTPQPLSLKVEPAPSVTMPAPVCAVAEVVPADGYTVPVALPDLPADELTLPRKRKGGW